MNFDTPLISVLMPIYNSDRYLRQSFDSLIQQTYKNFEVLCINDGSTDGSGETIREYCAIDERFRLIDKENTGYGSSMNRGIVEAQGDYIAILEPDDFFRSNALELFIRPVKSLDETIDIVKANYWFYWSAPNEKRQLITVVPPEKAQCLVDPQKDPSLYLAIPSVWSALYRKDFLMENKIAFLETPGASFQDLSFTFKTYAFARSVYLIDDPVLSYRQDNEASSVNDPKKAVCIFKELEEIDRTLETLPNKETIRHYVYRIKYDNYMWNFQRLSKDLRKSFFDHMKQDLMEGMQRGDYKPSLFYSWQNKNLELVLSRPTTFLKSFPSNPGKISKAWYYLRLGGPKMLIDALKR